MILQLLKTLSLEANDTLFCVIFIAFEYGLACYIRSFLLRWWSWSLQKRFQLISLDKSIQPTNLQYFCKWTFTFSILPQAVCPVNDHKYLDIETGYKLMNHLGKQPFLILKGPPLSLLISMFGAQSFDEPWHTLLRHLKLQG